MGDRHHIGTLEARPSFHTFDDAISEYERRPQAGLVSQGEYKLLHRFNSGDSGWIWTCDLRGQQCVAKLVKSKTLNTRSTIDECLHDQSYHDLCAELKVLSNMKQHPNLIGFLGACLELKNCPVLFEEYVQGPTLGELLQKCLNKSVRLPRHTAWGWSVQLLRGLVALHTGDPIIIHRDLKPSNIVLTADLETLKILDFGTGKVVRRSHRDKEWHSGYSSGNKRYMAPEVIACESGHYDERCDVFGAGLIMWRMASSKDFFTRANWPSPQWRPPIEDCQWPSFEAVIVQCWQHSPNSRPAASQVLKSLDDIPDLPTEGFCSPGDLLNGGGCGGGCMVM